jgi:hypothetical protein
MALGKGGRAPERIYGIVLWIVSVVFAAFIVGLGNLVIGDLPSVDNAVLETVTAQSPALQRNAREMAANATARGQIDDQLEIAQLQLEQARRASQTGTETFRAWIEARTATTNPQQDPEVLSRTQQLEQLKTNERALQDTIAGLENRKVPLEQRDNALRYQLEQIEVDAIPTLERARFAQELRVFGLRLLITLPMLLIATWLVLKKRKSDYWPMARGFVLAAVFVFFVELVPYLPSYGGYVRYVVGIVLTFGAGHFLIKNMRDYLARRQEVEKQAEQERRRHVSQDEAFKKMAAKCCPGCDRPIATTGDAESNFCVHCGMTLFDHCGHCHTRKMAFFRFCMTCGTPTEEPLKPEQAPAPA